VKGDVKGDALTSLGLTWSDDGVPVGYAVGKEAAMRDWQHRREVRDFDRLVNRLRVAKWQREHQERKRANNRRYAAKPEVVARALARRKALRAAKPAPVLTCLECGVKFIKRGRRGGTVPRFCCDAHRQRYRYHEAILRRDERREAE
jgi:hypothetical protein